MARRAALLITLFLGSTIAVAAAIPRPSLWLGANTGAGTYTMSKFNEEIANTNRIMEMRLSEVGGGFAYGLQCGVLFYGRIGLSAGYEKVFGATDSRANGYEFDYVLPARAWHATVQYQHPWRSRFHPGIAIAIGRISAEGQREMTTDWEGSLTQEYNGHGTLWQGALTGDLFLKDWIALSPLVGYRKARIHDLKFDDRVVYLSDGSELELDYSGFIARFGVKILLS